MKHVKYWIEYIILFTINALCFWFFGSYFNALIGIGMLVFAAVSAALPHYYKNKIKIKVSAPVEEVEKNQEVPFQIEISNDSYGGLVNVTLELEVGNGFATDLVPTTLNAPLSSHGVTKVEYPIRSRYAGSMEVQVKGIVLYDLLSFHSVRKEMQEGCQIYAMPHGKSDFDWNLNDYEMGMEEAEESNCKGNDFSDVSQIREYIPGDSIRDIHWKLSAKRDDIMVKDRLRMSSQKLRILFQVHRTAVEQVDNALEYLASGGYFLIENQVPVTLYFWSEKYQEIREKKAERKEEWDEAVMQVIYERAGAVAEEQFQVLFSENSYLRIDESGAQIR